MKMKWFRQPGTIGYRLEILFWQLWEKSFIRFLFVGGVNTLLGYAVTLLLRYTLFMDSPKWVVLSSILEIDLANTVMFLLLFPVAYTLQAVVAFRTSWRWQRLLIYPLSSIPNYALQQATIFIAENLLGLPPTLSYALASILPIPIMFFIVRFLVKPKHIT